MCYVCVAKSEWSCKQHSIVLSLLDSEIVDFFSKNGNKGYIRIIWTASCTNWLGWEGMKREIVSVCSTNDKPFEGLKARQYMHKHNSRYLYFADVKLFTPKVHSNSPRGHDKNKSGSPIKTMIRENHISSDTTSSPKQVGFSW